MKPLSAKLQEIIDRLRSDIEQQEKAVDIADKRFLRALRIKWEE